MKTSPRPDRWHTCFLPEDYRRRVRRELCEREQLRRRQSLRLEEESAPGQPGGDVLPQEPR